jgi:DNA-binding MarR family transcriptional regulator
VSDDPQLQFKFKLDEKFVKVMTHWLHDGTAAKLGGNAFLVLCFIRSFVGASGSTAGPSQIRISKALKLNIKTVRRCIDRLAELDFLKTIQTKTKDGKRNEYYLTELVLAKSQNKEQHGDAILQVPFGFGERKRIEPTLRTFEKTGKLPESSVVKVVNNITINMPILNGDRASATFNITSPEENASQIPNRRIAQLFQRAQEASQKYARSLEDELQIELEGLDSTILVPEGKNTDKN